MKSSDQIERLVKNARVKTSESIDDRILTDAKVAFIESTEKKPMASRLAFSLWRIILKRRITKLAAVAMIIIAVVIGVNHFGSSVDIVTPAYALEQTIQASHSVRYIHVKSFWASHEEPMEGWVEFYITGNVRNARMHLPGWLSPHDGDIEVVWKDNKAHVWIKKKNIFGVAKDNVIAETYFKTIESLDPKTALHNLQRLKSEDKVELNIERPEDKTSPTIVTANLLEKIKEEQPMTITEREITKLINFSSFSKFVLFIDQATKLITSIEFYEQSQGQEHRVCTLEYWDYNQPIASEMFDLEDKIPTDALRIDQTTLEVGLIQGDFADEEIAVELIRQFLQALIDRDYAKAGRLFGGTPAERIQKTYGQIRFIRIISIGKPIPCIDDLEDSDDHYCFGLHVHCVVDIEENGETKQWKPHYAAVRQVHGQPGRWKIISGFRGI
jgi:hypothetical protein